MPKVTTVGGQAVMEGVMMRGRSRLAIAVRQPDGQISVTVRPNWRLQSYVSWFRLPILRGLAAFVEALVVGVDAILHSANISSPDDVQLSKRDAIISVVIGLGLGVGMFMLLPTFLVQLLHRLAWPVLGMNLAEGALRLSIFLGYVLLVGLMPDMRRFYQYHGAEHKTIHGYEAGDPLDWAHLKVYSCYHPRCGTAFLLLVMLVSLVIFSFLGWPNLWVRLASRLALLPLVAGVAYELSRLATRQPWNRWLGWLIRPALLLQGATTREPDQGQVEVAIAALQAVLDAEPELNCE
ncbi:MAG: DUF1385 domain-containing protein [Bacillota bacterium]